MPARRIRVAPTAALSQGLTAIRREAGVPEDFAPDAQAEAAAAATRPPAGAEVRARLLRADPAARTVVFGA